MGSKNKYSRLIYNVINQRPNQKILVDLFCGGFSISEEFIKNGWEVKSNDLNKYVVALIREAIDGRFSDERFSPLFISRNEFHKVIKNPHNYEEWYVGYIMCCWSFGNNQKGYLFGPGVEPIKKIWHEFVVGCVIHEDLKKKFGGYLLSQVIQLPNWHIRRLAIKKMIKGRLDLEQLEQLQQLQRIERLQQLEQLEQLQQLERLQRFELTSLDYQSVDIPQNAVVYCDPPYYNTATYSVKFDTEMFWEWVRITSITNRVYVSEYSAPDDFKKVLRFPRKSTLQGGTQKHQNQPDECVFLHERYFEI